MHIHTHLHTHLHMHIQMHIRMHIRVHTRPPCKAQEKLEQVEMGPDVQIAQPFAKNAPRVDSGARLGSLVPRVGCAQAVSGLCPGRAPPAYRCVPVRTGCVPVRTEQGGAGSILTFYTLVAKKF